MILAVGIQLLLGPTGHSGQELPVGTSWKVIGTQRVCLPMVTEHLLVPLWEEGHQGHIGCLRGGGKAEHCWVWQKLACKCGRGG